MSETGRAGSGDIQVRLSARHDERLQRWRSAQSRVGRLQSDRVGRLNVALAEMTQAQRGRALARLPAGWQRADLYEGELQYKGTVYPLATGVKAQVQHQGNISTAQGWVMKTTHDTRELYISVEGPDWCLDIRAAKGTSSGGDSGAMVANFVFRQESKRAREFASAINNAARGFSAFSRRRREGVRESYARAMAAWEDTDEVQAALDDLRSLLSQRDEAESDLTELQTMRSGRRLGPSLVGFKILERKLTTEIRGYHEAHFVPGPRPEVPTDLRDDPQGLNALDESPWHDPATKIEGDSTSTVERHLRQLLELRDAGVLNDSEFAEKAARLRADPGAG